MAQSLNGTTDLPSDTGEDIYECKVYNISMLSLTVCVLTVTAVTCSVSYCKQRMRQQRDSAISCDQWEEPVHLTAVRWSQKGCNVLLKPEVITDHEPCIYYIFRNPLHMDDIHPLTPTTPNYQPEYYAQGTAHLL